MMEAGGKGVEYFSFASDENFSCHHTGERNSFALRKARFLTAGEKKQAIIFYSGKN